MKSKAVLLGVDTNVVIRFLTRDDAVEAERARVIFEREEVLLLRTVLLESEWILRNSYGFQRAQIAVAFADLAALSNVQCEDAEVIAHALEWFERGMDFADALYLAAARPAGRFATFERQFAAKARRDADVAVVVA